jgi:hypothetical protein
MEWRELVGGWVTELVSYKIAKVRHFEVLLREAGSWGKGIFQEHRERENFGVGNRYRATASEDVIMRTNVYRIVCGCNSEL